MRRKKNLLFLSFSACVSVAALFSTTPCRADFPDFPYQTETEPDHAIFSDVIYSFEYEKTDGEGAITRTHKVDNIITYGVHDKLDLILEVPYKYVRNVDDGDNYSGLDDLGIFPAYKFYNKDNLSLYAIPELTIPTGNYQQGGGKGKMTFGGQCLASKTWGRFTLDGGVEYVRNENKVDERTDIWHATLTPKYRLTKSMMFLFNFDMERDRDPENHRQPILIGTAFYYTVNDRITVYPAFETGLNKHEKDFRGFAGVTVKF